MSAASKAFLAAITARRSIYALSKKPILADQDVIKLVQQTVKHSPSSFNSSSSRIVILLGNDHDHYWNEIVPNELKKVASPDTLQGGIDRAKSFAPAYGTILFFEDDAIVNQFQRNIPTYADRFPTWSEHGSAIAQINTWTAIELEGYGANLQHYGNLTSPTVVAKYGLPSTFSLKAELVFGHPEGAPKDKTFVPDEERVKVFGGQP